jgi:hypothetical protein
MDKLPILKQLLIKCFADTLRKAQKGYPFDGYQNIREAMLAINMIENFTVDSNLTIAIVDYYLRKLNNI